MPRVYAKARNNDPTLLFNSREAHFQSGKGYAIDIRIRDYDGAAAQRYAEGVITSFWEFAEEAAKEARYINDGQRYGPGHRLHGKVYDAIVVPAWNAPEGPGAIYLWETREGGAEMVAAYEHAGVPLPQWLRHILDSPDVEAGNAERDSLGSDRELAPHRYGMDAAENADGRSAVFDDEFLAMMLAAVRIGEVITTLGTGRPNRIASVYREGLRVITERSDQNGTGPQLVPAWMVITAWDHLRRTGRLSQKDLLNDLNVKRSAFVCALLSQFPGVEVETNPIVSLRFKPPSDTAEDEPAPIALGAGPSYSTNPENNALSAGTEWSGAVTYAERLNFLFHSIHPEERGPFTSEEVAADLQSDGIPLHVNSITRLRSGLGDRPDDRISNALAFFFNVDTDYFFGSEAVAREGTNQLLKPTIGPASAAEEPPERVLEKPPHERRNDTEVDLTFTQLIRLMAGLSEATKVCIASATADEDLARRLAFLVSETTPLLLQALIGDVLVPSRFLERIQSTWAETHPAENRTSVDYQLLTEILGTLD